MGLYKWVRTFCADTGIKLTKFMYQVGGSKKYTVFNHVNIMPDLQNTNISY